MRKIVLLLTLCLCGNLFSQNYINEVFQIPSISYFKDLVEVNSDLYVLAHSSPNNDLIKVVKVNSLGDTNWVKSFQDTTKFMNVEGILSKNSNLYIYGYFGDSNHTNFRPFLSSFDLEMNLNWFKTYNISDSNRFLFRNGSFTENDGFILAGTKIAYLDSTYNFYLAKIDSLGNMEWDNTFDVSDEEYLFSVSTTSDKGYILSGQSDLTDSLYLKQMVFIKVDSLGNQQWLNTYGNEFNDIALSIVELEDKSFLATCNLYYGFGPEEIKPVLLKFDFDGQIIWEKEFSENDYFRSVLINEDNSFVVYGHNRITDIPFLVKYSVVAEEIWRRNFALNSANSIIKMIKTADNGFAFTGFYQWLVKTDCFGCDSTLCYYQDSICDFYDCSLFPIDADYSASSNLVDFNFNDSVTFINLSANTTNRVWNFGDGVMAYTDSAVLHIYSAPGTYDVELIVYHGMCSDTINQTVVVYDEAGFTSSLEGGLRWVTVYPNPNKGSFTIENKTGKELNLAITDAVGKRIENLEWRIENEFTPINLSLESGIYFVNLYDDGLSFKQKIVIEK